MRVNNKGFTLIELIVVIAIMGIILILALPQVSKIQEANKDRKYEVYKESVRAGSKLYIDSYAKDLFGNNDSGCIRIKYSELKQNNLVKDFGSKDISCGNDSETFVEVRKVLSEYKYKVNIVCRNTESNKVEWEQAEVTGGENSCSINPDRDGPEIKAVPSSTSNKWYNSKNLNIKIQVSDVSGLNANTSIIYNWYNKTTGTQYKDNSKNYKNKKGAEKVSFTIPDSKMPSDSGGKYKLTIKPDTSKGYGVQDVLGNVRVTGEEEEEYWIDNEGPKFNNTKVESSTGSYKSKKVIFKMDATDNFTPQSDLKVYISNSGYQKGGSWKNYSSQMSWTLTGSYDGKSRTIYISIKDLAGNITEKKFTYTVYKECQSGNITTSSSTGSCRGSCGTGTTTRTYRVRDRYTRASCSGDGRRETVSCNTGIDCCSKTYTTYGTWGSCEGDCGTGTKYRTVYRKSSYTDEICSQTTRGDSASCTLSKSCDTTPPACPTISSSVAAGKWTNADEIRFTFRFSSDTDKYYFYNRKKTRSGWGSWSSYPARDPNTTTSQKIQAEGIQQIKVKVCDKEDNCRECTNGNKEYKIDRTPPYTPYLSTSSTKTIDGTSVKVNIYGNCGKSCVAVESGRKNSVTLQKNKDACYSQMKCNISSKSTKAGRCVYTKKYGCGGILWTIADNTSKSSFTSGVKEIEEISNTDYRCLNSRDQGDHTVQWVQAVDNAGNKSKKLRVGILNYHLYGKTVLDKYYTIKNYEWDFKSGKTRPLKLNSSCFS